MLIFKGKALLKLNKIAVIQLSYLLFLTGLLIYLKGDKLSFLLGLFFSYFYTRFFFYSFHAVFLKKEKRLALVFLLTRWFVLLGGLVFVINYLSLSSFLIAWGFIPALVLSYLEKGFD